MFPDDEARLKSGPIDLSEKQIILETLGEFAQQKYNEFVDRNSEGYNLSVLKGCLQYEINLDTFDLDYYLEGRDQGLTDIANYFEYGTGLYNSKRAGKYRAGYIKPVHQKYMMFMGTKAFEGDFIKTKRVKGVKPIFAMTKTIAFMKQNRKRFQHTIRERLQNG